MKVSDFEKAIDEMGIDIFIDEFVIFRGHVKSVYAHNKSTFLQWDRDGKGYSWDAREELDTKTAIDVRDKVKRWERNFGIDIVFKDIVYK